MYLFFEKIVLPLLVAVLGFLLLSTTSKFDWTQRIVGALAVAFIAFFITYTIEKSKRTPGKTTTEAKPPALPESPTPPQVQNPTRAEKPHPSPPHRAVPKPQTQLPPAQPQQVKRTVDAITEGQSFLLKRRLLQYAGSRICLVKIGNAPTTNIAFEKLADIFSESQWHIRRITIGNLSTNSTFPDGPYMTSQNIANPIVASVFSIFSNAGVELPLAPNAFMAAQHNLPPPDVAIVIH